jgi:hypothetical protein
VDFASVSAMQRSNSTEADRHMQCQPPKDQDATDNLSRVEQARRVIDADSLREIIRKLRKLN